jgi:DNA invertase Pin-like site-specific DNA recombinase
MMQPQDLRALATYRRVSKKEQSDNAPAFKRQGWDLDREAAKYPNRKRLSFEDIGSGRKDGREEFQLLLKAIEANKVGILIVSQINRITRDLETNTKLQKLLQRKNVLLYEIFRGSFLDWENPEDWDYFVRSGAAGEKESRILSRRMKQTKEYFEAQGKFCYGRVGFPYRRSDESFIEPDPELWQAGIDCIKICLENGGSSAKALNRINKLLGWSRTRTWLSSWIRSPLLRGHTPKNTRKEDGNKRHRSQFDITLNTHFALFDDPQLIAISALERIDKIVEDNKRYKGRTRQYPPRPLSGLLYCGRCKESCYAKQNRNNGRTYHYVMCSSRDSKSSDCGGAYGSLMGKRRSVNTPYHEVETAVILTLCARATELVDTVLQDSTLKTVPESPAVIELRTAIAKLKQLEDDDLAEAIAFKEVKLDRLLRESKDLSFQPDRDKFIRYFSSPDVFLVMSDAEKRSLFREWVCKVYVDRGTVIVDLKI